MNRLYCCIVIGNVTGEPETMSEKDQRDAGMFIDVFGLPIVSILSTVGLSQGTFNILIV